MLTPEALLDHARRLLAGIPDEAGSRHAVSAGYYAAFDPMIMAASRTQDAETIIQDGTRRSIGHRDVRRVCEAIVARAASRPVALQRLPTEPLNPELNKVSAKFIELQDARFEADYDLLQTVSVADALASYRVARDVFDSWYAVLPATNTRTFFLALPFHERWTRRT